MLGATGSACTITILHSGAIAPEDLWAATRRRFETGLVALNETPTLVGCAGRLLVVDCDLNDPGTVAALRSVLRTAPDKALLFVIDRRDHAQYVQACALGADGVTARSPSNAQYVKAVDRLLGIERAPATELGMRAGVDALRGVFAIADGRLDLTAGSVLESAAEMVDAISEAGLHRWIEAVHQHHNATFQHCLLVTGTAVAFGQHLRFGAKDIERLLLGALVHDLGKVAVPVGILEKPGELDAVEMAVMREHPIIGRRMLEENGGFEQETIDVVAQHHEYLDGSGYPDGRTAPDISDLVRVITIADIFSALIERPAYRAPVSTDRSYEILRSMHGRLDMVLVRAFEPITRTPRKAA
jgi:putative nucleotidyltransferase with HDIG domain